MLTRCLKYILRLIRRVVLEIKVATNYKLNMETPDRKILETIIMPYFSHCTNINRVLFVGCEWYTKNYKFQFKAKEYWTIEPNYKLRRYGAKNHIIDRLENIGKYFAEEYFDLIIVNGVIGYGLDNTLEIEKSLEECNKYLHKQGILMIGWNNILERKVFNLDESPALRKFKKYIFEPLSCSMYDTKSPTGHIYNFYIK